MKINTKNQQAVAEAYAAMDAKAGKTAEKMITESWAPMIERTTGVKDAEKLSWMSQLAHNTAKAINEDAQQIAMPAGSPMGGAMMGNVYAPYNTLYNTLGVGNVVPAGKPALTANDFAGNQALGSGDKLPGLLPLALKVAAKTIGFELVNTTPLAGPAGVLPYMDYAYTGSKQPFGATPAFDHNSANPARFNQQAVGSHSHYGAKDAFSLYGLPHMFKANCSIEGKKVLEMKQAFLEAGVKAGSKALIAESLEAEFIGWSRIDGEPMFHVIKGEQALGEYFIEGSCDATITGDKSACAVVLSAPRLVSMQEDNVQGFAGSGELDTNPWYGTYQDGTVIYDPMSRATGELTPARQISLQLFTRNITVGTIQVACAVTQEQVTDLQKQWGIDVVKVVENAAVNELSQTINRHITSRLFALGWKNQLKLVEVEGPNANLNLTFDAAAGETPAYAYPEGKFDAETNDYESYANLALPTVPAMINTAAHFENRDTLLKRIFTNILAASNWIQQRGRYGAATFVVTNITVATLLQSDAHYAFSPIENTVSQGAGQLYPIGTVSGMTVYVDPLMSGADTRVLVGRKGAKDEPGVHFCPYVMAEVYRTIAEGTMAPKLMVKSRYALVDAGFFPETQYLTFYVDCSKI